MSFYQFYRFETVDSDLTREQRQDLGQISTRAEISYNHFSVFYDYSDLNADPRKLMLRYFDLGYYFCQVGSPIIYIRVPKGTIPTELMMDINSELTQLPEYSDYQLLEFYVDSSEEYNYLHDDQIELIFEQLANLRSNLIAGDYRALYCYWLSDTDSDFFPPKLPLIHYDFVQLSNELDLLIDLLDLPRTLIRALALLLENTESHQLPQKENYNNYTTAMDWISQLSNKQKDQILIVLFDAKNLTLNNAFKLIEEPILSVQPHMNFHHWLTPEMLNPYIDKATSQIQIEAATAKMQIEMAQEKQRITQLEAVYSNRIKLWIRADNEASRGSGVGYTEALEVITLLLNAYQHKLENQEFMEKYREFYNKHKNRPSLIKRLTSIIK